MFLWIVAKIDLLFLRKIVINFFQSDLKIIH
jgi:hypothetical protein